MSNQEQCSRILSCYSEEQLGLVLAFMRGIAAAEHMEVPNVETLEVMDEADEMIKNGNYETYSNMDEMMRDVFGDSL